MVLRFFLFAGIFLFMSCTEAERNNPDDPDGNNYSGVQFPDYCYYDPFAEGCPNISMPTPPPPPSSSSRVFSSSSTPSSSSASPSSSSSNVSSSAVASSSSSVLSSSSVTSSSSIVSSSSSKPSSSSVASSSSRASSSSSTLSSSSVASSSSRESSSSSKPSSSSGYTQANVVYGDDVLYQNQTYKTVKIGSQTWFQRNLNYNVSGSKCGVGGTGGTTGSLSDENTTTCDTYGRLYNWATAMKLSSSCNTSSCATQISAKHQGICPNGWHIPSDADWSVLLTAVGGFETAGKYLKATNSWNSGGNGEDKFGFAALPGDYGSPDGSFGNVGYNGNWWSATEDNANIAYNRGMFNDDKSVKRGYNLKYYLFSVRCVQD